MSRIVLILCGLIAACSCTSISIHNTGGIPTFLVSDYQSPTRVSTEEERSKSNESTIFDFIGLVHQYEGYTAEEYTVQTDDGYNLILHRITGSPKSPKSTQKKPVVYVQHGLFGSSDMWVVLGPNNSIAFQLADKGYDVFLGNFRGNTYSRSHVKYSPNAAEFWNFGLDEIALRDLPALLDFALKESKQDSLTYIGHSMGTSVSYILLSERAEYNEKINLLISLSPVAHFTHQRYIISLTKPMIITAKLASAYEILPLTAHNIQYARTYCTGFSKNLCKPLLDLIIDTGFLNFDIVPQILSVFPAGASLRTLEQFYQIINSGKLQKYDHGCFTEIKMPFFSCENKKYYNQTTPPAYDLSLIKVPTALFYSENDAVVDAEDAELLRDKLSNVISCVKVPGAKFNHMDFLWSTVAKSSVNDPILELMETHVLK